MNSLMMKGLRSAYVPQGGAPQARRIIDAAAAGHFGRDAVLKLGFLLAVVLMAAPYGLAAEPAASAEDPAIAAVRVNTGQLVEAFQAAKLDEVVSYFLPDGELIDEEGNLYEGQAAIKQLLTDYFAQFPGVKVSSQIESIRRIGPIVVQEATRDMTTHDGADTAHVRYVAVWIQTDQRWRIASLRDYSDDAPLTPHANLQPLEWLVGDWVNEGSDAVVHLSYRWSESQNFLVGDIRVMRDGQITMDSTQRIGWDPVTGKIHSWTFDSDGGFAEGVWTADEDAWVIKSSAVLPDGQTGSATLTIRPTTNQRYVIEGTDRIVGETHEDDYQITIAKKPPAAGK